MSAPRGLVVALVGLALGLGGCGERDGHASPEDGLTAADSLALEPPSGPSLTPVEGDTAQGRTGPGGRAFEVALRTSPERVGHSRRIGQRVFDISLRSQDLVSYPCASCHRPGEPVVRPDRIEDAHQDIQPVHPAEIGALCLNCHAPDRVDLLVLESGERVGLDHTYRLCAQCHFAQADAWANGAHGKRLDGWRGPRVVMGCAECHDPHRPAVAQRIPFPGPRIPRAGGENP